MVEADRLAHLSCSFRLFASAWGERTVRLMVRKVASSIFTTHRPDRMEDI
ncbi:hypothetical protein K788_0004947 [Paraburkholderia caribensis MBA4]|uniref:Uncharacterized protein n=1 Tax=Paraburkholderia caribensis MBA4 TaxID=1323664 RepID=A0A0P0R7V8_9BURK|nr:hypothetical protein K788_0004947 [Paraburkholderia caribensis MBA4]